MYLEKYEGDSTKTHQMTATALQELVDVALKVSDIVNKTGFASPTVIT